MPAADLANRMGAKQRTADGDGNGAAATARERGLEVHLGGNTPRTAKHHGRFTATTGSMTVCIGLRRRGRGR
ncbi:hypothetical protein [Rhodococcus sp. OK302]|uniref:hypothetical protein n=1 Tax=Rhodococcus sp. OK302 TaxID=1882769 RepID=UPI001140437D|nr:hypothetical protein [Rhodococcus sp. OK302]